LPPELLQTPLGELSQTPDPLAGLGGGAPGKGRRRGGEKEGGGRMKGRERMGREGREGLTVVFGGLSIAGTGNSERIIKIVHSLPKV